MTLGPLMIDIAGTELSAADRDRLSSPLVGAVILFSRNYTSPRQLAALTDSIHALRSPPLLIAVDQEGGRVQRFREHFTELPPARWLGRQFELDVSKGLMLTRQAGWLMAAELRELGVDLSFAPVVDLDSGISEIIGDRAFHGRPEIVSKLAAAWCHGMADAGMASVAKHFPGHGAVAADSHLELPVDGRDADSVLADLEPYEHLIREGIGGVMIAHVRYPQVDRRVASLSPFWIQNQLRDQLGFAGVVFSDDLSMSALAQTGDMLRRTELALSAGADMAIICNDEPAVDTVLKQLDFVPNAVSHGRLAALRPRSISWEAGSLQHSEQWSKARASLAAALEPPALELDG